MNFILKRKIKKTYILPMLTHIHVYLISFTQKKKKTQSNNSAVFFSRKAKKLIEFLKVTSGNQPRQMSYVKGLNILRLQGLKVVKSE